MPKFLYPGFRQTEAPYPESMPAVPRKPRSFADRFNRALNGLLVKLRVEDVPHIKRIIITVVGGTVMIFGMILVVTPGPGALVIMVGLAILGMEYAWARRWLRNAKRMAKTAIQKTHGIIRPGESAAEKAATAEQPGKKPPAAELGEDSNAELVGSAADSETRQSR